MEFYLFYAEGVEMFVNLYDQKKLFDLDEDLVFKDDPQDPANAPERLIELEDFYHGPDYGSDA